MPTLEEIRAQREKLQADRAIAAQAEAVRLETQRQRLAEEQKYQQIIAQADTDLAALDQAEIAESQRLFMADNGYHRAPHALITRENVYAIKQFNGDPISLHPSLSESREIVGVSKERNGVWVALAVERGMPDWVRVSDQGVVILGRLENAPPRGIGK